MEDETGQRRVMGSNSEEDYQLGVALVSILVSIMFSVGFGVYSVTDLWWAAFGSAVVVPSALAALIRLGGDDGVIPKLGQWVLGRESSSD